MLGRLVGAGIVLGAVGLSLLVYASLVTHPRTDDAYVRANTIGIAPHVSGPIVALPIVRTAIGDEGRHTLPLVTGIDSAGIAIVTDLHALLQEAVSAARRQARIQTAVGVVTVAVITRLSTIFDKTVATEGDLTTTQTSVAVIIVSVITAFDALA